MPSINPEQLAARYADSLAHAGDLGTISALHTLTFLASRLAAKHRAEPPTAREISDRLGVAPSTVTRIAESLGEADAKERKRTSARLGFITRLPDADDARRERFFLSPSGTALVGRVLSTIADREVPFEPLTPAEWHRRGVPQAGRPAAVMSGHELKTDLDSEEIVAAQAELRDRDFDLQNPHTMMFRIGPIAAALPELLEFVAEQGGTFLGISQTDRPGIGVVAFERAAGLVAFKLRFG